VKVFLLRHYDYEIQEVLGVYATRELAEAAANPPDERILREFHPAEDQWGECWIARYWGDDPGRFSAMGDTEDDAIRHLRGDLGTDLTVQEWEVQAL
jgi:hypothetical protein